jgi:hypothetical protein
LPKTALLFFDFHMGGLGASRRENWVLTAVFSAALLFHFYSVTLNWKAPFMSGHEFRQAQTAITAYYIDQQNNFSLLYETPILGKPWVSILMEVPFYEWSVVLLSRATGLPHFMAARTVSVTCFYLMLPAVYLLLARFRLARSRRLLLLALVLTCPVYIYYTRAFLMESMELMCCAWFLLGLVRTMDSRRWSWLLLAVVAGTGAALIKSVTLAVWLMPAAAYGGWMLWRDIRAGSGWRAPVATVLWGAATVGVALGTLRVWIAYTDPIKAAHASAWIFTSKNLSEGNWGLFQIKPLFYRDMWDHLMWGWDQAVMSRWLIGLGLLGGVALPAARWRVLGFGGIFLLAQCLFPFAYAYQDYYFYACAIFLNMAFGCLLLGVLDTRLPRWGCAVIFLVPFAGQISAYWHCYRPQQVIFSQGGYPYTDVLRDLTPPKSVIVVAGADWAAMTPLYAQRKALMIRNGLEYDEAYLERAFNDLAGEEVSALVLYGPLRTNRQFIQRVADRFDLDATTPTYSHEVADVYVKRPYRGGVQLRIKHAQKYYNLTIPGNTHEQTEVKGLLKFSPDVARDTFLNITPSPFQAEFQFGLAWMDHGMTSVLSAHPNSDLWLRPPDQTTVIKWVYGIFPGAYEPEGKTNGVEFLVHGEMPDGHGREIYRRVLDPRQNPGDRGDQHVVIPYAPLPGEILRFSTRPNGDYAFDWAYWAEIDVK